MQADQAHAAYRQALLVGELLALTLEVPSPESDAVSISIVQEADMITFRLNLKTPTALVERIAHGEVVVSINGGSPVTITTDPLQASVEGLVAPHGARIDATLTYIGLSGKRSAAPAAFTGLLPQEDAPPNPDSDAISLEVTGDTPDDAQLPTDQPAG